MNAEDVKCYSNTDPKQTTVSKGYYCLEVIVVSLVRCQKEEL